MNYVLASIAVASLFEFSLRLRYSSKEYRARVVETFFALAIGFSAIASITIYGINGHGFEQELTSLGNQTLLVGLGFFAYHLHRVIFVGGFAKSLIVHHLGMILCILAALITKTAGFYILLASIPITSAAMRNFRWFWRTQNKPSWRNGALMVAGAYIFFESVPPIIAVAHFFTIGINTMELTPAHWAFLVTPGLLLSLLTFYWSGVFLKKTLKTMQTA